MVRQKVPVDAQFNNHHITCFNESEENQRGLLIQTDEIGANGPEEFRAEIHFEKHKLEVWSLDALKSFL